MDPVKSYPSPSWVVLSTVIQVRRMFGIQKCGCTVALSIGIGAWLTPKNTPLLARISMPNFVVVGQMVRGYVRRLVGKFGPLTFRISRSLEVIESDTNRSGTYDFLIVILWAYLVPA